MLRVGAEFRREVRITLRDLRADPRLARLIDDGFRILVGARPVLAELRVEAAVLAVHAAREPDLEHLPAEVLLKLAREPFIVRGHRRRLGRAHHHRCC